MKEHSGHTTYQLNFDSDEKYLRAWDKELAEDPLHKSHMQFTAVPAVVSAGANEYFDNTTSSSLIDASPFSSPSSQYTYKNGTRAMHSYDDKWYRGYVDCVDKQNRVCRFVYDIDSSHKDGVSFDEIRHIVGESTRRKQRNPSKQHETCIKSDDACHSKRKVEHLETTISRKRKTSDTNSLIQNHLSKSG